jgi:PHP family Zn ribbon phosphoesterase
MNLDRKCIKCQTEFQLKPKAKASNICTACKTDYQRAYARKRVAESPDGYKEKYPYKEHLKIARFRNLRNALHKMDNREEWQEFFKQKLDDLETIDKEVLIWIYDRRDHKTLDENRMSRVKEDYEDTRSIKENDKSWFD